MLSIYPLPTPSPFVICMAKIIKDKAHSCFLDDIKSLIWDEIHCVFAKLLQPVAPSGLGTSAKKNPVSAGLSDLKEGGESLTPPMRAILIIRNICLINNKIIKTLSSQEDIFGGLGENCRLIKEGWQKPEKGVFIPRGIKRRYPEIQCWRQMYRLQNILSHHLKLQSSLRLP